ncbi:hypothetical protein NDU88_000574, partial [Pleurodeles waltl]
SPCIATSPADNPAKRLFSVFLDSPMKRAPHQARDFRRLSVKAAPTSWEIATKNK